MDMNPPAQILTTLASFRAQIAARPDLFRPVADAGDVERAKEDGRLAVAFDLEGGVPLAERPEMVRLFYDLGVRQIHLAYNRNNTIGGGCYDADAPLTDLGRRIVAAINETGMFMDCSHTGYRTSMDIIEASSAPVIFSHSNPRALHEDGRNIRDDQIDACAATGGVVCVNGVGRFLGDRQAGTEAILRHIDSLVGRIGRLNQSGRRRPPGPGAGFTPSHHWRYIASAQSPAVNTPSMLVSICGGAASWR